METIYIDLGLGVRRRRGRRFGMKSYRTNVSASFHTAGPVAGCYGMYTDPDVCFSRQKSSLAPPPLSFPRARHEGHGCSATNRSQRGLAFIAIATEDTAMHDGDVFEAVKTEQRDVTPLVELVKHLEHSLLRYLYVLCPVWVGCAGTSSAWAKANHRPQLRRNEHRLNKLFTWTETTAYQVGCLCYFLQIHKELALRDLEFELQALRRRQNAPLRYWDTHEILDVYSNKVVS
jgi:hypothetical protein